MAKCLLSPRFNSLLQNRSTKLSANCAYREPIWTTIELIMFRCRRQFSKYTCPTCNIPYCSLTCFRSEVRLLLLKDINGHWRFNLHLSLILNAQNHFTRKRLNQIFNPIPSRHRKKWRCWSSSRILNRKMVESKIWEMMMMVMILWVAFKMLTWVSSKCHVGFTVLIPPGETSTGDLWSKLTTAEQKQFMKIFGDPTSGLAQQLLASKELEDDQQEPWWEAPITVDDGTNTIPDLQRRPEVLKVPVTLVKPWPNGPSLAYNTCAIWWRKFHSGFLSCLTVYDSIAYSYATRRLAMSPLSTVGRETTDIQEAQQLIFHLVPFLVNRKSTVIYSNLSQLIPDLWSRFQPVRLLWSLALTRSNDPFT